MISLRTGVIFALVLTVAACLFAGARFNNISDGTVKDNGTGLIWQKCSRGQNSSDCSGMATQMYWVDALKYCRNLTLAGKNWRLPNVKELRSLVDYTRFDPALNPVFFPNTQHDYYWSSTTFPSNETEAYMVRFGNGDTSYNSKNNGRYIRCVTGP